MKRISREHLTCEFASGLAPVGRVRPGEKVLFETLDAVGGRIRSLEDALTVQVPPEEANPATGPVFVEGAEPGDTLEVRVLSIDLGPQGYCRVTRGGVLIAELDPPHANIIPVEDGTVRFNDSIRFAARPMVGVIGVAPSRGSARTFDPGSHGGNLDINALRTGSAVYLPVSVPGALLCIGDVHASMGDGELNGGGIDIDAEVVVQTRVHRGLGWRGPVIETPGEWCACAHASTLSEAVRGATRYMTDLLSAQLGLSREEAFVLIGATGDARLGQAAELGVDMTAYVCISKEILRIALERG